MSAPVSILFHRGNEWGGPLRGSTNVLAARFLAAGHPVAWLERPVHLGHRLRSNAPRPGFRRTDDGALVIRPFTLIPRPTWRAVGGGLRSAWARAAYRSIVPSLRRVFARAEQPEPAVLWTCGGDGGALRRAFPAARRIVQCVDVYEAYAGSGQNALEALDYADADRVVTIGHALAELLVAERDVPRAKLSVIGQGADLDAYTEAPEPDDLAPLPRPRLTWVGRLAKADARSMAEAATFAERAGGSLVLIGPRAAWAEELTRGQRSVHVLGPRDPARVPAYLMASDVGLMLYDQRADPRIYAGQNPLKLYEMAAAGLPIVSTPHAEYAHLDPPALIATGAVEVEARIEEALRRARELSRSSRAFAQRHGWSQRFDDAAALVREVLA
ncbi:MAG: glycosyltransferase family 1 protein [bacterium]|nr:glycosyltransferase family 1 protein [bacterium]